MEKDRRLAGIKGECMRKVSITADTVLNIIQSVFNDNDVDNISSDDLPADWQGKSIQELLNIKYYTFKHRPESTEMIIREKRDEGEDVNELEALNRSFGCLVLNGVDRIFATNIDVSTCSAKLDFWVQTSKIKLLEYLIDKVNIALSGRVLPLEFKMQDNTVEHRTVALVFGRLDSPEYDTASEIGESVQCSVDVELTVQPETILMANIKIEFATEWNGDNTQWTDVIAEHFSLSALAQTKSLPLAKNISHTGTINTSLGRTFSVTIPAMVNNFTTWLTQYAFGLVDINTQILMRLTIGGLEQTFAVIVTDLHGDVKNDGTDLVYSLTLSEAGL